MSKSNKELITSSSSLPDIQRTQPKGFENFEMKDLIIPRIRLMQGLSKAVVDGVAKMGDFQDSLTEEIFPANMEIVLLGMKNGAVYFKKGEGLVCKSEDGHVNMQGEKCVQCPYNEYWGKFKGDRTPPACSATKEFIILRRDSLLKTPYPMLLSFLKTSYPLGKRLASMARLSGSDIFSKSYLLGSEKISNAGNTWSMFTVKPSSMLTPDELVVADKWFEMMRSVNVQVGETEDHFVDEV